MGLSPEERAAIARSKAAGRGEFATDADLVVYQITPKEEADLADADDEIARSAFATDEQVQDVLAGSGAWFEAGNASRN